MIARGGIGTATILEGQHVTFKQLCQVVWIQRKFRKFKNKAFMDRVNNDNRSAMRDDGVLSQVKSRLLF